MTPVRVSWVHSLLEEHATLLEHVGRARDIVAAAKTGVDRKYLLWLLEEIDSHLSSHMTLEEEGGYLNAVRERLPHRSEEVDRLQEEHATLHSELVAVMKAFETSTGPLAAAAIPALDHWLRALAKHEDHENTLMQEAFNADYGSGD